MGGARSQLAERYEESGREPTFARRGKRKGGGGREGHSLFNKKKPPKSGEGRLTKHCASCQDLRRKKARWQKGEASKGERERKFSD